LSVLDLNSLAFTDNATRDGSPVRFSRDWMLNHVFTLSRRKTIAGEMMEQTVPSQSDCCPIGATEPSRRLDQRIEHRLKVAKSGPFAYFQEISVSARLRGGGCSRMRTCLSL
jgi:hypothetical protein